MNTGDQDKNEEEERQTEGNVGKQSGEDSREEEEDLNEAKIMARIGNRD